MKKVLIITVIALLLLTLPVAASADRLSDGADLLTAQEEILLTDRLDEVSLLYGVDVVIVTTESIGDKSAMAYADDYFDYGGYGSDGVLLLVDMGSRQWWISTAGSCMETISNSRVDSIGEAVAEELSYGNYADAFHTFVDRCEDCLSGGESEEDYSLLISAAVGLVISLIAVLVMKGQLKTVRHHNAGAYEKPGSMHITQAYELFLYRNVNRVAKQTSSGSHTSSSGRSHGGGGGRF